MSMVLDSLEATSLADSILPAPESAEAAGGKRMKLESETETESESETETESETESETELESETPPWELKPLDDLEQSDFYMYDNDPKPIIFRHKSFVYMNKAMMEQQKAVAEYKERCRNLSAWDAIPPPPNSGLCGGVRPYSISDGVRPRFIHFSNLALSKYNADNQGANFVFDDLVKVTSALVAGRLYYITFKAKDASNNSAAQTFQAKVWDKVNPKGVEPEVMLVRLKPT